MGSQNTEHLHLQWAVPEAQPRKKDLLSVVSSFPEISKWDMGGIRIREIDNDCLECAILCKYRP